MDRDLERVDQKTMSEEEEELNKGYTRKRGV
jgi:hypothetical protein